MKKKYIDPEMDAIRLEAITTSDAMNTSPVIDPNIDPMTGEETDGTM